MVREQLKCDIPPEWLKRRAAGLCPVCGKHPSEFDKNRKVYCSEACSTKYAEHYIFWGQLRDKIIEASPKCAICGITEEKWKETYDKSVAEENAGLLKQFEKEIFAEKIRRIAIEETQFLNEIKRIESADLSSFWLQDFLKDKLGAAIINEWKHFRGFEVDHLVPVYKGGSIFDESNLQVLCVDCHRKKTNKDVKHRKRNSESNSIEQKKIEEVN